MNGTIDEELNEDEVIKVLNNLEFLLMRKKGTIPIKETLKLNNISIFESINSKI